MKKEKRAFSFICLEFTIEFDLGIDSAQISHEIFFLKQYTNYRELVYFHEFFCVHTCNESLTNVCVRYEYRNKKYNETQHICPTFIDRRLCQTQ